MKRIVHILMFFMLVASIALAKQQLVYAKQVHFNDSYLEQSDTIRVRIEGEIMSPGHYELNKESYLEDLIRQAGGLTEDADSTLNLSKRIYDEEVIIIPSSREKNETFYAKDFQLDNLKLKESSSTENESFDYLINLNTAPLEELMKLPGIGESKGQAIIDYRNENGGFKVTTEIMEVKGIGAKTFEKLEAYLSI